MVIIVIDRIALAECNKEQRRVIISQGMCAEQESSDKHTHPQTDGWTDATKYIISLASRSIIIIWVCDKQSDCTIL